MHYVLQLLNTAPNLLSQHDMPSGDMDAASYPLYLAFEQCRVAGSRHGGLYVEGIALAIGIAPNQETLLDFNLKHGRIRYDEGAICR